MSNRVEITAVLDLPTPVKVPISVGGRMREETVVSVEWTATAYVVENEVRVRIRGLGRGHYSVWISFPEETAPKWAPKPPQAIKGIASTMLKGMLA
jgi:hypothetical protein